jgi:phosphopantetheinyl transferase (holo-ACP synthase)
MIGVDIVDLQQARLDSNWRRKGYLDKLFTATEQSLIAAAPDADQMVWLLWTMKESAYKIDSRKTGLRSFAPVKLVCSEVVIDGANATGMVSYRTERYYTHSELHQDYIRTIASGTPAALQNAEVKITGLYPDYKSSNPQCVSHHGRYLALAFKC